MLAQSLATQISTNKTLDYIILNVLPVLQDGDFLLIQWTNWIWQMMVGLYETDAKLI